MSSKNNPNQTPAETGTEAATGKLEASGDVLTTEQLECYRRDAEAAIERAGKATKGPWCSVRYDSGNDGILIRTATPVYPDYQLAEVGHNNICYIATPLGINHEFGHRCHELKNSNAVFVCAARADVPTQSSRVVELVGEVEVLRRALKEAAIICSRGDGCDLCPRDVVDDEEWECGASDPCHADIGQVRQCWVDCFNGVARRELAAEREGKNG